MDLLFSWNKHLGTWDSCTSSGVFAVYQMCPQTFAPTRAVRYISMAPKKFLGLECSTSKQYPKYYIHVLGVQLICT
jgi:hypothetical protein